MKPTISIVTPSFNQGRFIERTIQSVLGQSAPPLEYLVFDGGSTDETVDILRRYDGSLSWISKPDGGQADAVNKGIAAARGDIIGWLNSDDVYTPGALAAVTDALSAAQDTEVLYGDAQHIDEDDGVIEPYYTEPWSMERLKEICFLCQPAVFFRRSLVDRFGPLDAALRYCMDYEFWLRLALGGARFCHLPRVLAGSRLYSENKTLRFRRGVHAEINDMLRVRLGRVPDRWLSNYAHALLDDRGVDRKRPTFPFLLSAVTMYASLHWNRTVSRQLLSMMGRWMGAGRWPSRKSSPS